MGKGVCQQDITGIPDCGHILTYKQFPSPYVVPNPCYIWRYIIYFDVWEGIEETMLSTFLHS